MLLEVMANNLNTKPSAITPPFILSIDAVDVWGEAFDANKIRLNLPIRQCWIKAIEHVYKHCKRYNIQFTDPEYTAQTAYYRYFQKLFSLRQRIVHLYERTGWLAGNVQNVTGSMLYDIDFLKLGNVRSSPGSFKQFFAYPSENGVYYTIYRRITVPDGDVRREYDRLVDKYSLLFIGDRKSHIKHRFKDISTGFRISERSYLEYFLEFNIETDYVPEVLFKSKPIPTLSDYSEEMIRIYFETIHRRRILNKYIILDL